MLLPLLLLLQLGSRWLEEWGRTGRRGKTCQNLCKSFWDITVLPISDPVFSPVLTHAIFRECNKIVPRVWRWQTVQTPFCRGFLSQSVPGLSSFLYFSSSWKGTWCHPCKKTDSKLYNKNKAGLNSIHYITIRFPKAVNIYRLMGWACLWKYRARGKKCWYFPCLSTKSHLSDEKPLQPGTPAHCLTSTLYLWSHIPGANQALINEFLDTYRVGRRKRAN